MLRSSTVQATAALRSAGRRRSRCLSLRTSITTSSRSRHWSGGIGDKTTPNRPPGLEPTRRPLQGRASHEYTSSSDTHSSSSSSRRASSSWAERPSAPGLRHQQQERGRHGAACLPRRRRLSSTPWCVGDPTAPPASPPRGPEEAPTTADGSTNRQQRGARGAGSSSRQRSRQQQPQDLGGGWASELLGLTNGRALCRRCLWYNSSRVLNIVYVGGDTACCRGRLAAGGALLFVE